MNDENPKSSMIPSVAEIESQIAWHQDELKWAKWLLRLARKREAETPGPLLELIEGKAEAGTDGGEATP